MKLRFGLALALAVTLTGVLAINPTHSETAQAQIPPAPSVSFPCTNLNLNQAGTCVFTLTQFTSVNGGLTAVGIFWLPSLIRSLVSPCRNAVGGASLRERPAGDCILPPVLPCAGR